MRRGLLLLAVLVGCASAPGGASSSGSSRGPGGASGGGPTSATGAASGSGAGTSGSTAGGVSGGAVGGTFGGIGGSSGSSGCYPGYVRSCYDGPPGTEGVGICHPGTQSCLADGSGYGPCVGEVLPQPFDNPDSGLDQNCDGQVNHCLDQDGDGWTTCDGDCCDSPSQCTHPELVNPGAFEVEGDGVDNDCDPTTSDTQAMTDCGPAPLQAYANLSDQAVALAQAMELCRFTTENPPLAQRTWGVISAELVASNGVSLPPDPIQSAALSNFGSNVHPIFGGTMAALSSGTARAEADPGWIDPHGGWESGDDATPPAVYLAAHGGMIQSTPQCFSAQDVHDTVNLRLHVRVPTNARSLSFRLKFYTAEYPEFVCTQFNDFFLAELSTDAGGIPADHNISFDALGNPISVNNGFFEVCDPTTALMDGGCPAGDSELVGTGTGGGTRWLRTTAPVVPGEEMTLEFVIWDTGDHAYDSLVLLDDFRWSTQSASVVTSR